MKKIFTLVAGTLLTAAVFAADHRPMVTLINNGNFRVVIDGKSYFGNNMTVRLDNYYSNPYGDFYGNSNFYGSGYSNNYGDRHTIKVFEMRRGFFVRERLVDATTFQVGRNDLMIHIDRFGSIDIREMRGFGRFDRDYRGWDNRDNRGWDNRSQDNRGWDNRSQDNRDNQDWFNRQDGSTRNMDHQDMNNKNMDPKNGQGKGF